MTLQIYLLGPFAVYRAGAPVGETEWKTSKVRGLLKRLALEQGQTVHRERLMECLWPDATVQAAAHSLDVAVSRLRRVLEPGLRSASHSRYVESRPHGYRLTEAAWVDAAVCARGLAEGRRLLTAGERGAALKVLDEAVRLYRGDLLAEDPYEEWAIGPREALRAAWLEAVDDLAGLLCAAGRPREALAVCQPVWAADPWLERVGRRVMESLILLGDLPGALRTYDRMKESLAGELGVAPGPETEALLALARQGGRKQAQPAGSLGFVPAVRTSGLTGEWPLVGRAAELAELERCLARAAVGQGGLVLIEGEAGSGKSRLVGAAVARALGAGTLVLIGRCYEPERELPYQPWCDALRQYLAAEPDTGRVRETLGPWAPHLASLVPELAERLPGVEPRPADDGMLMQALASLFLRLAAQRPVLLVLEDLHWAGESTLRCLAYAARRATATGLLLLGTGRSEEPGPWLEAVVPAARRIMLGPLSAAETAELIQRSGLTVPADLAGALAQETGGSPLYLTHALRVLAEGGPPAVSRLPATIAELMAERVRRVNPPGQRLLEALAVLGRPADLALLEAAVAVPAVPETLDQLIARRLVMEVAGRGPGRHYELAHTRLRDAVLGQLSGPRAVAWHRRILDALTRRPGARRENHAAELAFHAWQGEEWDAAFRWSLQAGEAALNRHQPRAAAEHLARALSLADRVGGQVAPDGRLRAQIAYARALTAAPGNPERVVQAARAAMAEASAAGDPRLSVHTRLLAAQAEYRAGRLEPAIALARDASQAAQEQGLTYMAIRALGTLARMLRVAARWPEVRLAAETALDLGRRGSPLELAVALNYGLAAAVGEGRFVRAGELGREAAAIPVTGETARALYFAALDHAEALMHLDLMQEAVGVLGRAAAIAAEQGLGLRAEVARRRGWMLLAAGAPDEAEPWFRQALASAEAEGDTVAAGASCLDLAVCAVRLGNAPAAGELLARADDQAMPAGLHRTLWHLRRPAVQTEVRLAVGDPAGATAAARQAVEGARRQGERPFEAAARLLLGQALLAAGHPAAAQAELAGAAAMAVDLPMIPLAAQCHILRGEVSKGQEILTRLRAELSGLPGRPPGVEI